jgi:hypothetical protein
MGRRPTIGQAIPLVATLALVVAAAVLIGLFGHNSRTTEAASEVALSAVASDAEDAYSKGVVEIDLSNPAGAEASGVSVRDGTVKIGAAGVYSLSGTLNGGQIEVDTKGKVYLELDGVVVTSASGPALWIKNAKKVTLVLAADSTNSLADSSTGDADAAALFSNDTLVVTGGGTLSVVGNNSEGICGDDDIMINSGTIMVTAVGDGIAANDDITINGGKVTVTARGDGLDSNGTVHVNGGSLLALGGTGQGEGGIAVRGPFTITGGTVVAAGNAMVALSTDSRQTSFYVTSSAIQPGGTAVRLVRDGQEVFAFTPEVAYQNVLISSGDLTSGVAYQAYLGDKAGNLIVAAK